MIGRIPSSNWYIRKPRGSVDMTRHGKRKCELITLTMCYKCRRLHRSDRPCPVKNRPAHTVTQTTTEVYRQAT